MAEASQPDELEKLELIALRWAARGLAPAEAAQKVLMDQERGRRAAKRRGSQPRR